MYLNIRSKEMKKHLQNAEGGNQQSQGRIDLFRHTNIKLTDAFNPKSFTVNNIIVYKQNIRAWASTGRSKVVWLILTFYSALCFSNSSGKWYAPREQSTTQWTSFPTSSHHFYKSHILKITAMASLSPLEKYQFTKHS